MPPSTTIREIRNFLKQHVRFHDSARLKIFLRDVSACGKHKYHALICLRCGA